MRLHCLSSIAAAAAFGDLAAAQCQPEWLGYGWPYLDGPVHAITIPDLGTSQPLAGMLVAGGNFDAAASTILNKSGVWTGEVWLAMSSGAGGTAHAATMYSPPGQQPQAVLGGFGFGVLRYDGVAWQPFGTGLVRPGFYPHVRSLTAFGGWLVAGGSFQQAGAVPAPGLAYWDGASWHAFPDTYAASPEALHVHAGELHAGGGFGPSPLAPLGAGVLRWNGQNWIPVGGNPPTGTVYSLASYGGELYAGGNFYTSTWGPPQPADFIARFDGASWQPVGAGLNWGVRAMIAFDADGAGPMPEVLAVGGNFWEAGGQAVNQIASWDGQQWRALGAGTNGTVRALAVWRGQLAVGGEFTAAGGIVSPGLAFWGCPQPAPCFANCDQSTTLPLLNIDDFTCFINQFAAGLALPTSQQRHHYANCDSSTTPPVLNVDDFTCFINEFAHGCF
jgi:trimeric autotransporter adhesin